MGWVILIVLTLATLAALAWVARPRRGPIELVAAMLLVAVAGYAWQGRPTLGGKPAELRTNRKGEETLFATERAQWLERVGGDAQALDTADALIRNGDAAYAVGILRGAVARRPNSMMLWLGLGNALVAYADGSVAPPARYAFQRAAAAAPNHPAPAYFLALEYAQSGDLDTAEAIWRGQLKEAPADAPWRMQVAEKLIVAERLRAELGRP